MDIEALLKALPDVWRPAHADPSETDRPISRIRGGRNNRVYRYRTDGGRDCIAKLYHEVPVDEATRLRREYTFLHLMNEGGITCVPKVLFADFESHLALYSFIKGTQPSDGWQEAWGVEEAIAFLRELQSLRDHPVSHEVPNASEACFTLKAHAGALRRRIDRLDQIERTDDAGNEAGRFFDAELRPVSEDLVARIESLPDSDRELTPEEKWLSPSDFGFHNSLITDESKMVFLDFEHAGWDDPGKLIADFCNQPDHVLHSAHEARVRESLCQVSSEPDRLRHRIEFLVPLYQAKWACILLNEFLPFGSKRRKFLGRSPEEEAEEKKRQLERSRMLLERAKKTVP